MKLKNLLKGLDVKVKGSKEVEITGLSADSRTVAPGNLFLAKRGAHFDGAQFIPQAINAGAAVIVTDIYDPFLSVTQVISSELNQMEAQLAARYYGHPAEDLFVVGVTGTKGKTTTSYLVKHLLDGLNMPSGLIGTVETILGNSRFFSKLTTHDVITNHKWLREMVRKECRSAVMEVSSHGLSQGRVAGIQFDIALFTNLYPDHLDYHRDMDDYAAAKKKLFAQADCALLNADSPWSSYMISDYRGKKITFGIEKGDLQAKELQFSAQGTRFLLEGYPFFSPLIGRFNVYNVLGAIAVGLQLQASLEQMSSLIAQFPGAPARLERVGNVFIDFAHNGEALKNVLETLKGICKGRLIVVFGCGGNRDPQRRIGMGQAADQGADISILTSDNPRQEDPAEIIRQIASAFRQRIPLIEIDRQKAIHLAIAMAKEDDFVLIAGKGHERVQIFAHHQIPFDDLAVAKEALQNLANSDILLEK